MRQSIVGSVVLAAVAAVMAWAPFAATAQSRSVNLTLEVVTDGDQQSLRATRNSHRCTEMREGLIDGDLEETACIQTPVVASGGFDLVWTLESDACEKGESGYTLREIMLADERGVFRRPVRTRTRQDFRVNKIRPTFNTGEFRRRDSRSIVLTNANSAAYVVFYRVVGRNCATGESLTVEAPISIGGRSQAGLNQGPL